MPRAKAQTAALLASPDDVEAQFYEALQQADLDKLMAVWSDDDEIACVHPGGPRVSGYAAIRASFEAIFANGAIPLQPQGVRRLQTLGCAVHHLVERVTHRRRAGQPQRLGAGHQRLRQDRPGLAHGGAPCQPGQRSRPSRQPGETPSTLH